VTNVARLLRETGREDEAVAAYDRLLDLTPGANRALMMEAAEYRASRGEAEEGRRILERALKQDWDPLSAALLREARERIERFASEERALSSRGAEVEAARKSHVAILQARYFQWQGRWEEMLATLSIPEGDGVAPAHLYRGVAQLWLGDAAAASASFTRAIELDPSLHLAHNNAAWLLATREGRPQAALALAERAVALLPEEPEYHDTYAEVLERLGRTEDARKYLAQILPQFPQHAGLRERGKRHGVSPT
jgi:tetratricopeptide (TPR) repeat protein